MPRRKGSSRGGSTAANAKKNSRGGKAAAITRSSPRNVEISAPPTDTSRVTTHRPSTWPEPVTSLKRAREEQPPKPATPAVEPVEQRWEESEGKYMHKKFKKMASSNQEQAAQSETVPAAAPQAVIVTTAGPVFNHFPLKHSALSLVQTTSEVPVVQGPIISSNYRIIPSHPSYQQAPVPQSKFPVTAAVALQSPPTPSTTAATTTTRTISPPHEEDSQTRKRNVCPFCQMVCAKPSVLDKHIRTHTNERPYPCEPCGFAFKTKSNLYKHCKSRTHSLKVEKGIDSSSADIMAELGDTLREEIDSVHQPAQPVMPPLMSNGQLRYIEQSQAHSQNPAEQLQYRPITLQQLPTTTSYTTPVVYKPLQEVRHTFAPSQQQHHLQQQQQHQQQHPSSFASSQLSPRREYVVIAQAPHDSRSSPATTHYQMQQQHHQQQQPLVNYATLRLPQAQPILVRPHASHVRIEDNKNLVLPQRPPLNLVPEERTRLPIAPLPMSTAAPVTTATPSPSSNLPTDLSMGPSKKVAPEFLQQRIDKVISENQAIVETLDPLWPRRYMRQSSKDQSNNEGSDKGHGRAANRKYNLPTATTTVTAAATTAAAAVPTTLYTTPTTFVTQSNLSVVAQQRPQIRFSEVNFPKQPVPVLASTSSGPRMFSTTLPQHSEKPIEPVYVMASNPLDLATSNRKRQLTTAPVIMTQTDSTGLAGAQSVKEVWINSCKKQAASKPANVTQLETIANGLEAGGLPFHPENPEGSMIKELLLKTRIINLTPVSSSQSPIRRESTSSSSSGSQIYLDSLNPNKNSSKSEVSLILTSSSLSPLPVPKTKLFIPSSATTAPSEIIHCNLCQCKFIGIDLDVHQRDYCTATAKIQQQQQQHDEYGLLSPKRAKLSVVSQGSSGSVVVTAGKLLYTGGGIVSLSKIGSYNHSGLLQIAQPVLHSGGGIMTTSSNSSMISTSATKLDLQSIIPTSVFSIPGIPTPNLSGVLTNIKATSMPLFSLPGKRFDLSNTLSIAGTHLSSSSSHSLVESSRPCVPFVLGIPGPYSQPSTVLTHSLVSPSSNKSFLLSPPKLSTPTSQRSPNGLTRSPSTTCQIKIEVSDVSPTTVTTAEVPVSEDSKFLRPNSLPLTPGSFKIKKQVMMTSGAATLVSPETPRPRKSYALQYQNGTAYTYLGMKCSTRVCYCCIFRPQPMYVMHKPKLSMYSNWRVVTKDSHPSGLPPADGLAAYSSIYHQANHGIFTLAGCSSSRKSIKSDEAKSEAVKEERKMGKVDDDQMIVTHSSQWKRLSEEIHEEAEKSRANVILATGQNSGDQKITITRTLSPDHGVIRPSSTSSSTSSSAHPPAPTTVEGGYKSLDDDYTYVRGRGRGRYVCNSCGIRCKKPSMLKKHIRTHSNFRPYTCRHCNFAFKTKGNLTKHMKSKAHHKKCVELGISPVPTTVEETQHEMGINDQNFSMHAGDSDSDDDDMEEEEEEDEDQFEDAEGGEEETFHNPSVSASAEKEDAARSLLSLHNEGNNSPAMTYQGLLPNRPKPSTNFADFKISNSPAGEQQPSSESSPLRSEQALVSANTKRAQDLQADATTCQETGLNLKQFPPPNTAERYYFSSPANHSAPLHDLKTSVAENSKSLQEQVVVAASGMMSTPSPMIWSIARMSKMNSPSAAVTTTNSYTSRPNMLPIGLGGAVSIYKTSTCISSISCTTATTPNHAYLAPKERTADILSPVTESAQVLSYINKSSSSLTNGGSSSRLFESESDPPALGAYLQERAAVRAANKSTPFNVTGRGDSVSPKSATPNKTQETASTSSSTTAITSSMKSQFNATSEDKYAPRNVTMNVKDLPEDVTSSGSRHNQLPQDVHLATATAMAKGAASAAAAISSAASSTTTTDVNLLSPVASDKAESKESAGSRARSNSESQQTEIFQTNEDGKSVCGICSKIFSKASQLRLHVNIHYFERPFRCDSCAVSFRTKGHLQKHKRSVGHFNKVNINATFGTPTASNPRPFKCSDCKIAFRIHGHLAKHLRSKMHIMKLECSGKLPIGMYAEMERLGTNLNEIDTSDCENSLESLQQIAVKLYKQDPSKLIGRDDEMGRTIPGHLVGSDASDTEDSETPNGETVKIEPTLPGHQENHGNSSAQGHATSMNGISQNSNLTNSSSENFSRRASFSSSGHDDHSTDSEAETGGKSLCCYHCPQSFIDMKSLQIHIFVDHQNTKSSQGPPNKVAAQPSPNAPPLPTPPQHQQQQQQQHQQQHQQHQQQHQQQQQTHNLMTSRPPQIQLQSQPMLLNGHHYKTSVQESIYRRQTSSSSGGSDLCKSPSPSLQPGGHNLAANHQISSHVQTQNHQQIPNRIQTGRHQLIPNHNQTTNTQIPNQSQTGNHQIPNHNQVGNHQIPNHNQVGNHQILHNQAGNHQIQNHSQTGNPQILNPNQTGNHLISNQNQTGNHQIHNPNPTGNHGPLLRHNHINSQSGSHLQPQTKTTFNCDLCGMSGIPDRLTFQQHLLSHAAPRPFVCGRCDAGFVSQHQLESHLKLHEAA